MTLALAMLLDAILGEPAWLWRRVPHPAVLMGRAVGWLDARFNTGDARRLKGTLAFAALATSAVLLGFALAAAPGWWLDVIVCAILLAQRSLSDHVRAVATGLRQSLPEGRRAVSLIVSRDTGAMTAPQVARSAIESASENLSDGVIAPAFWFLVGGLPGLLLYKVTNTADSMIGYLTPRHAEFGWAAARFDDLLNLVPARLTALLIWVSRPRPADLPGILTEAPRHRSPNAGWPEAAMARVLGVALSGPRSYDGVMRDYPYVHPEGRRHPGPADIDRAVAVLWQTWAIALTAAVLAGLL